MICWGNLSLSKIIGGGPPRTAASFYSAKLCIKTLTIKNLERIDKNSKSFFVKFQAPFSQKIINLHLYMSNKAFICSVV